MFLSSDTLSPFAPAVATATWERNRGHEVAPALAEPPSAGNVASILTRRPRSGVACLKAPFRRGSAASAPTGRNKETIMRKFLASALAAVTFGGAVAAAASPATAAPYRYHHSRHHGGHGDAAAAAVVAGIAGLAIGAALSDGDHDRRSSYYRSYSYDPRYDSYGRGYYDYGPRYRLCTTRERVWDPYIGRRVMVERQYRC
jgi:hypothetical protein